MMSVRSKVLVMTRSETSALQPCFILHTRKYRDTSSLVEVFSRETGRYTLVARGARSKNNRYGNCLQLFVPLLIASVGQGELKTARNMENNGAPYHIYGPGLIIGMYVNELLYRLLGKFDPYTALYDRYETLLNALQSESFDTFILRDFELSLLSDLGYGISFDIEAETGDPIIRNQRYHFVVEDGFHYLPDNDPSVRAIEGEHILDIADGKLDATADQIAKWVIRQSINQLLGGRILNSRMYFSHRLHHPS